MELTMTQTISLTFQSPAPPEFVNYFWMFYGPGGVYETKGLTRDMAERACAAYFILVHSPDLDESKMYSWGKGDTDDRTQAYALCVDFYQLEVSDGLTGDS